MDFEIKKTKNKTETVNKTLYISKTLAGQVQKIANDNDTSFNSMIEHCLKENDE